MKRFSKLLILSAVLLALLGSYQLVNHFSRQAEVSEEAGAFALTERSADELTGLRWTNEDTEYHFEKEEGVWVNADDGDFPTDQDAVEQLAERIMGLTATRRLSDVETLADYGFSEDSFSVTVEWSDGEDTRYLLGDETPFADGWYTRIDGEEGVIYTAESSLSAMFSETAVDLAELEEIGNVETAQTLAIGDALRLERREAGASLNPDQHWYDAAGEPMEDDLVETLIEQIEALEWQSLLTVHADEEELEAYLLDADHAIVISVQGDDDDAIEIFIGMLNEEDEYYARLPESGMVYTLDAQSVDAILDTDADSLWNAQIFDLDYADVAQFACVLDGEEWIFVPENGNADEEDGQDAEEDTEDPYAEIWDQIQNLHATDHSDNAPSGEALLHISVTGAEGAQLNCDFYGYDVDSYVASTDSGRCLLVSAEKVDKLIRTLRQSGDTNA